MADAAGAFCTPVNQADNINVVEKPGKPAARKVKTPSRNGYAVFPTIPSNSRRINPLLHITPCDGNPRSMPSASAQTPRVPDKKDHKACEPEAINIAL